MLKNKKLVGLLVCVSVLLCSIFVLTFKDSKPINNDKKQTVVANEEKNEKANNKQALNDKQTKIQEKDNKAKQEQKENKEHQSQTSKQEVKKETPKQETPKKENTAEQKPEQSKPTPNNPPAAPPPSVSDDNYVTIAIDCKTILNNMNTLPEQYKSFVPSNGIILSPKKVKIKDGDTVFDVVIRVAKQRGIPLSQRGGYIQSINNLVEKMFQGSGGWMYAVNGSYANVGSTEYTLKNNDKIEWRYTCYIGDLY